MADGKPDNSDGILYVMILGVIVFMIGAFFLNKIYWLVNAVVGSIAWLHVTPFAILGEFLPFLVQIPLIGTHLIGPSMAISAFLAEGNFQAMSTGPDGSREIVMSVTGRIAVLIYGPFLLKSAFTETKVHVDGFYKKTYDLETMMREQARTWKVGRMFMKLDPLKSSEVKPSLLLVSALQKALSAAEPRGPMMRSICATSLPSPTSDSPTRTLLIFAMVNVSPWLFTIRLVPARCRTPVGTVVRNGKTPLAAHEFPPANPTLLRVGPDCPCSQRPWGTG